MSARIKSVKEREHWKVRQRHSVLLQGPQDRLEIGDEAPDDDYLDVKANRDQDRLQDKDKNRDAYFDVPCYIFREFDRSFSARTSNH